MYRVEIKSFEDFTKEEQKQWVHSNNGCGKECATYIVEYLNDEIIDVHSDAIEPEDATFSRDLDWIEYALQRAYNFGYESK